MDLHGGHHWIMGEHFRLFTINKEQKKHGRLSSRRDKIHSSEIFKSSDRYKKCICKGSSNVMRVIRINFCFFVKFYLNLLKNQLKDQKDIGIWNYTFI